MSFIEEKHNDHKKEYVAYCKNSKTNFWYHFDDHNIIKIDDKSVFTNRAVLLFYQRKPKPERLKEMRNVKSQIKLIKHNELKTEKHKTSYIPNFWYEKAISLASPGMVHTTHLLCKHGKLKPSYYDCFPRNTKNGGSLQDLSFGSERSFLNFDTNEDARFTLANVENQSVKLPKEIGDYLVETYGGGPLLQDLEVCVECVNMALNVRQRRRMERDLINKYEAKNTGVYYAVPQSWIELWKNFLYTNNRFLRKNFTKGYNPPPPVFNQALCTENSNQIKSGQIKGTDYLMVNQYVWRTFEELYGGGPKVIRKDKDLYSGLGTESPAHELSKSDKENIQEMKNIINEEYIKQLSSPLLFPSGLSTVPSMIHKGSIDLQDIPTTKESSEKPELKDIDISCKDNKMELLLSPIKKTLDKPFQSMSASGKKQLQAVNDVIQMIQTTEGPVSTNEQNTTETDVAEMIEENTEMKLSNIQTNEIKLDDNKEPEINQGTHQEENTQEAVPTGEDENNSERIENQQSEEIKPEADTTAEPENNAEESKSPEPELLEEEAKDPVPIIEAQRENYNEGEELPEDDVETEPEDQAEKNEEDDINSNINIDMNNISLK
jgi:hypothetical protein